jgi:serine protease Do
MASKAVPLLTGILLLAQATTTTTPGAVVADGAGAETVEALLERVGRWVVAIEIKRNKDLPAPFEIRGAAATQLRNYFKRPTGPTTGILLDGEGHVITAFYNVAGAVDSIRVILATGDSFPAKLLGKSLRDDVALLRIETNESLPDAEPIWADSSQSRTGQLLFALGRSPDPQRLTATEGIVSATRRNAGRAIQTDAKLNYGNAGGPLVDLEGRIVAMASRVGHTQPQWGINSGVGFGTSASTLLAILPQLKEGRDVEPFRPPFLGIRGDLSPSTTGARVQEVIEGSAAAQAGVLADDIIREFNGIELYNFGHLRRLIFTCSENQKVRLKIQRGEQVLEVEPILKLVPQGS